MKSKYFELRELVPPEVWNERGDRAWELLDPALLSLLDRMYEKCGPFKVNDWHAGGTYKESGLRSAGTSTGAKFSQHKFGRAADCKPASGTIAQFFEKVKLLGVDVTIEDIGSTLSWLHVDVRNNQLGGVRIVKP